MWDVPVFRMASSGPAPCRLTRACCWPHPKRFGHRRIDLRPGPCGGLSMAWQQKRMATQRRAITAGMSKVQYAH